MSEQARILVVEDEQVLQELLVRRLASRGFAMSAASDGPSALKFLENHRPDLVLLDVQMPGMSGLEVLAKIRQRFTRDGLPVILTTALGDHEDVLRGLEAGANDYIVKPVDLPILLARMNVWLQVRRDLTLLMEAERQRVLMLALGEACHQIAQPMTAVSMTLESLIRHPVEDPTELKNALQDVLQWTKEAGDVIHRMQDVSTMRSLPYTERLELFNHTASMNG